MKKRKIKRIYKQLDELYELSEKIDISKSRKFVIFSDLHMGDGSAKDDFQQNSVLFKTALEQYYLPKNYGLILNGDIEELQRFSISKIKTKWKNIYDLYQEFNQNGRLYKLIGNHDLALCLPECRESDFKVLHCLTLKSSVGEIQIFHGHQASMVYEKMNKIVGFTLRYLANPFRIKNYSVAHNSRKQFIIEKRIYHYSSYRKRAAVIGHTHRPLFESMTKPERLKYKIEELCRKYILLNSDEEKKRVRKLIKSHKKELRKIFYGGDYTMSGRYIYNSLFHIPCLFNSGCVVGKRGMTCLEIDKDEIALVHWFNKNTTKRYLDKRGYEPERFGETDYYRMVLNKESLNYVFSRIKLLA